MKPRHERLFDESTRHLAFSIFFFCGCVAALAWGAGLFLASVPLGGAVLGAAGLASLCLCLVHFGECRRLHRLALDEFERRRPLCRTQS